MKYNNLVLTKENSIGIVTIKHPKGINLLSMEVFSELYDMFTEIENDPEIRIVILTGTGKAFIAGVDVNNMIDMDTVGISVFIDIARRAGDKIYNLNKPVIAAVNGFALGGGCELALECDFRIASEDARFGQPEINLGIIPGGGGIQKLARFIGIPRAKELVYTGKIIDAQTALEYGIVNKVVPSGKLMDEAMELAEVLASKSSVMLAYVKKSFNSGMDMSLASGQDMDECHFGRCFGTYDQKEGMTAFVQKRKAEFQNK